MNRVNSNIRNLNEDFNIRRIEDQHSKRKEQMEREAQLQTGISDALLDLCEYGWYINFDLSFIDIVEALTLIRKGSANDLDKYMSEKISDNLAGIKQRLFERHFNRVNPLTAAFRAHEMKEYYLSIPVFFAQTDGISKELTNFQFFLTDGKPEYAPKVKKWADETPKIWVHKALCAALLKKGAFQLHHSKPNKISITRHSILHGEINNYGTEINSLRAISLLIYVSDVMSGRSLPLMRNSL